MKPLKCIVCNYQPESAIEIEEHNQPYKATTFITHGHYGSTFFDPMDNSAMEINVCDECLKKAETEGKILYSERETIIKTKYRKTRNKDD